MVAFARRHFALLLGLLTIAGMAIEAWPVLLAWRMPGFQGLLPYGGSEEAMYLIRTQQALLQPLTNVTNGIFTGEALGLQSSGVEQLIGALLWWTGLSGPWATFLLHVLIAPLMMPFAALIARKAGAREPLALAYAAILFWYFVYGRRYFHPGFSLPLTLGTLWLLWRWYEVPSLRRALLAGIPMGFAVGVYLWSWTFLWVTAALLALFIFCDRALPQRRRALCSLPVLGIATIAAAMPALQHLLIARMSPFFTEASVRAGLVHTRLPESWSRSIITVLFALAACWLFRSKATRRTLAPLLAVLVSLAVMYNQQLVHGTVMSFSSHYIHYVSVALGLLIIAIACHSAWTRMASLTVIVACVVLLANFRDMSGRLLAFAPPSPETLRMQHLADALRIVNQLPATTIVSDMRSADILASYTKQDVAFTEFSGFLLLSDTDYIQRACLSELFAPQPVSYPELVVHAEARLRVLRKQETQQQYDYSVRTAQQLCDDMRRKPMESLRRFGVEYVLWNSYERPYWSMPKTGLTQTASGSGWSLWQVQP